MELYGVPATPDSPVGAQDVAQDVVHLSSWFQKGWNSAASVGEKGADLVAGMFDRLLEADGLGYDNDGDQTEN